jgi:dTDP-4-amino-4,6-dideoxygalactose transaminase
MSTDPVLKQYMVGRPNMGSRAAFLQRVEKILDSRWFTNNGAMVQEFEARIVELTGAKHAIAMCNATVAMSLVAQALELKGEVIVPSYTFVATAHAFSQVGVTPVFADIDPHTHNIDPSSVAQLVNRNTCAIVGVHLWGRPCEIGALQTLADQCGVPLLLDAAHALGCSWQGRMIGQFGRCEVFSFHATKFVNSFEGGMITTNDDELADKLRLMRNFGFAGLDHVVGPGTNAKMTEVCAAMGLTSLESMHEFVAKNRENHQALKRRLDIRSVWRVLDFDEGQPSNFQYLVVEHTGNRTSQDRDLTLDALRQQGFMARKYFWPCCHRMPPYRGDARHVPLSLANTEQVADRVIVLPTGQDIGPAEIGQMADILCGL